MQDASISVIVPVFNGERCIERCLRSIVSGETDGVECIVVDDGSTDGTGDLVTGIAKSNPCVRLIRQSNSGVSAARNVGLREASGSWVMFVDADDTLVDGWFQVATEALIEAVGCTMILFGRSGPQGEMTSKECLLRCVGPAVKEGGWPRSVFMGPSSKLYSSAFLNTFGIMFPEDVRVGEDLLFNADAFVHEPRVWFCQKSLYLYWKNLDSVTNTVDSTFIENENAFHRRMAEVLQRSNLDNAEVGRLQAFNRLGGILGMLAKTPFSRQGVSVMRETLTAQGYASALKCKSLISSSFPPYRRLQLQLLAKGMVRSAFLIQSALRTAKRVIYKKSGNTRIERI